MNISGINHNVANDMSAVQVEVQKKSEDVVKNVLGNLLEKTFENTKAIEEAAKATGKGNNLDIKA
jgi:hypothetical protein